MPSRLSAIVLMAGCVCAGAWAQTTTTPKTRPADPPANLRLDASKVLGRMDGFGGNYCFGIESPVTDYTLGNLRVAWARTEMTLTEWEPRNDNADSQTTDWDFLRSQDKPDSNLRREFLLAQRIQKKGIPYCITVWRLPQWCCGQPATGKNAASDRTQAGMYWSEALESIGSYLLHAKKVYGVEPDLFSFNEPDAGVYVRFTADEHRDLIRRLGELFGKLQLKTKCLLGDVSRPSAHAYIQSTADDPEAMRYVGALSFHTWHEYTPVLLKKWAAEAARLKLPLLVAEVGLDPTAWQGKRYQSFEYGLQEVRLYQELIRHAQPRGTMQWEFTSDYGLVDVDKGAAGGVPKLVPHHRYWFFKQFCNLTPADADVLETVSDRGEVLFTALRGGKAPGRELTLHIANFAGSRAAVVTGIPEGITDFRVVYTSQTESFHDLPPAKPAKGELRMTLPARALVTLTTLKDESPKGDVQQRP